MLDTEVRKSREIPASKLKFSESFLTAVQQSRKLFSGNEGFGGEIIEQLAIIGEI